MPETEQDELQDQETTELSIEDLKLSPWEFTSLTCTCDGWFTVTHLS